MARDNPVSSQERSNVPKGRPPARWLRHSLANGGIVITQELHRGRLIDHIHLVVANLDASRRFYEAILEVLGIPVGGGAPDYFWADELFVSTVKSPVAPGQLTGRHHLAFQAKDRAMVERFYKVGLGQGGKDNGGPGERPYHPGYYAAFLLDPDGNNIEAVYHGSADRSPPSVKITF
ncbi:MAG: VOC family protein [Mesorhizobium sp.]|nr:MAG: VOC family protein [Mesorhizobium sp.]RWP58224.1 MAG: VOC family protein [Mesorhizobium sp.]RWQ12512.1 MAG: VOC family protein [Mesorhizobium sp.]